MKKILFGITNLNTGGAERTLVDLVNVLANNYQITILTLYGNGELEKELKKHVKVISLFPKSYQEYSFVQRKMISLLLMTPFFKRSVYKKYIKKQYDKIISFLEGPMTHLFALTKECPIAWIHTDMKIHETSGIKGKLKIKRNQKDYQKYQTLVFVNELNLNAFSEIYKTNNQKMVIQNYVDVDRIQRLADEKIPEKIKKDVPIFVTVARLVYAKRIDRLIEAHAKLIKDGYFHKCYVIGDGVEKEQLSHLIQNYHVEDSFFLLGRKENPYPYMKLADYFLLPSLYEGSPIVLYEAMLLGKSILITDNDSKEVIKDYSNKMICENSLEGIIEGMKKVMEEGISIKEKQKPFQQSLDDIIKLLEEKHED